MKIGFLMLSQGFSGAERALYSIIENIKNEEVFLITNQEMIRYYSDIKNIKRINLGNFYNNKLSFFINTLKSNKIINNLKLDILIILLSHSLLIYSFLKNKPPMILSLRGEEINRFLTQFKPLNKFFMGYALKKATKIHSHSNWQIQNLNEKNKKKIKIIPNGINYKTFTPLTKIKQKKNLILFTGRYINWKGIDEILLVAKQLSQYEFWFAGQGPLSHKIKGKNVKNLGFKTTNELVKLYNQATLCVFPSHWEGFGNVGLEAMSCGKAVIATPLGFSEYIENGKNGIIIPPKNENALKEAIVDLMTNEKKRKMIEKNARKKALEYSWEEIAKGYYKLCKEVLKEHQNEHPNLQKDKKR